MSDEDATPLANAVVHFDIAGPDEAPLHRFYAELLGWQVRPQGPGYALVSTSGGIGGAIVEQEAAALVLGVAVADVEAVVARAERLGATGSWARSRRPWRAPARGRSAREIFRASLVTLGCAGAETSRREGVDLGAAACRSGSRAGFAQHTGHAR